MLLLCPDIAMCSCVSYVMMNSGMLWWATFSQENINLYCHVMSWYVMIWHALYAKFLYGVSWYYHVMLCNV